MRIGPEDLTLFYQPLAARVRAQGSVTMTVRSLIETAITQSDNSANDSLLRTVGGPGAVRAYLSKKDLGAIRFGPGERLLQSGIAGMSWQQSYSVGRNFETARSALSPATRRAAMDNYLANPIDGASPTAVASALARLARGTLLSPEIDRISARRDEPDQKRAEAAESRFAARLEIPAQDRDRAESGRHDRGL